MIKIANFPKVVHVSFMKNIKYILGRAVAQAEFDSADMNSRRPEGHMRSALIRRYSTFCVLLLPLVAALPGDDEVSSLPGAGLGRVQAASSLPAAGLGCLYLGQGTQTGIGIPRVRPRQGRHARGLRVRFRSGGD